ncbi:MAG: acyl-CoA synthetase [Pseudomonadota bacterium]
MLMAQFATLQDKVDFESEVPIEDRWTARTVYEFLSQTVERNPDGNALTFQITSGPKDKRETFTYGELLGKVTQAANLFRSMGIGEGDVVAYLLPNCNETVLTFLGGLTAGIVNPINPLLEPEKIASILRDTGAKVLVTLAPMPKTNVNELAERACALAPNVETILEVDLNRYLSPPKSWIVPLIRPKRVGGHSAKVLNFNKELAKHNAGRLDFEEAGGDPVGAYFHTGGTTGMPKVAQHRHSGMIYNGWASSTMIMGEGDVCLCPLPMFHVYAAYPVLMTGLAAGAHVVFPTPQGYRGDGVFDNFWKLIEEYKATFMVTVPTAAAALMQRPIDADVSTLRYAVCGSAPLPLELFKSFEAATGVKILEGYGMTEATCMVSVNPPHGERKVGSVGLPYPYADVRILDCAPDGTIKAERGVDEAGEICVHTPGVVVGGTYTEVEKNNGLFADGKYLRTGDLGRIDADGFLWITGRAKDLIIRGGHNIDPAIIEEAMIGHPDVAFVGAIGQPDSYSGELPAAYVELNDGANVSLEDLRNYAKEHIAEQAALPKHIEIMDELPKTAVGKIFKPDLRRSAITRIYNAALEEAAIAATVSEVIEDKKLGLVAVIDGGSSGADDTAIQEILGKFNRPWRWAS